MWLSTMMSVGRSVQALNVAKALPRRSRSLASPTRTTFHP